MKRFSVRQLLFVVILLILIFIDNYTIPNLIWDFLDKHESLSAGIITLFSIPGAFLVTKLQDQRQKKIDILTKAFFSLQKLRSVMAEWNTIDLKTNPEKEELKDSLNRERILAGYDVESCIAIYGNKKLREEFRKEQDKLIHSGQNNFKFGEIAVSLANEVHKNYGSINQINDNINFTAYSHTKS